MRRQVGPVLEIDDLLYGAPVFASREQAPQLSQGDGVVRRELGDPPIGLDRLLGVTNAFFEDLAPSEMHVDGCERVPAYGLRFAAFAIQLGEAFPLGREEQLPLELVGGGRVLEAARCGLGLRRIVQSGLHRSALASSPSRAGKARGAHVELHRQEARRS